MRKLGLTLLLAALVAFLAIGCADDYPKPSMSHLYASESCGVAPLRVDFRAETAGGKPLSDPTGGNNWLKMSWDFGDGTRIENGASIAYHRYDEPGLYTVTVTTEDDLGATASRSLQVHVNPDTLTITPYAMVLGHEQYHEVSVPACYPMTLRFSAVTCGFDERWDSFDRFVTRWTIADQFVFGSAPQVTFWPDQAVADTHFISVLVQDPGQSVFRLDSLKVVDIRFDEDLDMTDLSLSGDWWQTVGGGPNSSYNYEGGTRLNHPLDYQPLFPADMPLYFTFTVRIKNEGVGSAYNMRVTGTLHQTSTFRHGVYHSSEFSTGTIEYTLSSKRWVWHIPEILPGSEEFVDITFFNEEFPLPHQTWGNRWPRNMYFPAEIVNYPYPCDVNQNANDPKWKTSLHLYREWD